MKPTIMDDVVLDDDQFVTVNLDDEFEECDICHQATEEAIIHVILDDMFTIYDGSYDKRSGRPTKTHQVCLDRWSDIIRRNLKSSKKQTHMKNYINSSSSHRTRSPHRTVPSTNDLSILPIRTSKGHDVLSNMNNNGGGCNDPSIECKTQTRSPESKPKMQNCDRLISNKDISVTLVKGDTRTKEEGYGGGGGGKCQYDTRCLIGSGRCSCSKEVGRKGVDELSMSSTKDLIKWIEVLRDAVSGTSQVLVEQLQLRDKFKQEVSGQKSLIGQLIKKRKELGQIDSPSHHAMRHSVN